MWLTTDLVLGSDIWADYSDECSDVRTIEIRSNIKVNGKIGIVWMNRGPRMKSAWRAAVEISLRALTFECKSVLFMWIFMVEENKP